MKGLGLERRSVRPSTPLDSILPEDGRREKWQKMQQAMSLKLPDLQLPGATTLTWVAGCVMLTVGCGIYFKLGAGGLGAYFLAGLFAAIYATSHSPGLAVDFPHRDATVGDLARHVLENNYSQLAGQLGGGNQKERWETFCDIVVRQIGVEREAITRDARIVDDLGID